MVDADKTERVMSGESTSTGSALAGEALVSFHYDGMDTLIGQSKASDKEQRFYRNEELANEIRGADSSTFVQAEGVVLAEHQAGVDPRTLLLAGDDKSTVMNEVSQGTVRSVAYSPYGHRPEEASVGSHLGYNGHRREAQSGWYLLGNGYRVLNPLLMRFHSPDSLSPFGTGGLNPYAYCVGDPINNVDPTGHSPWGWLLRRFGKTTASSIAQEIPSRLVVSPNSRPALLKTIKSEHVADLKKVKEMYNEKIQVVEQDLGRLGRGDISGRKRLRNKSNALSNEASLVDFALSYAKENIGHKGITRYSAKNSKKQVAQYAMEKKREQIKRLRELRQQLATDAQQAKANRIRGERSFLGDGNS